VTTGAPQREFGGYIDGFATAISAGGALRWSTYVGGTKADRVEGVFVSPGPRVVVAGRTLSQDFPTRHPVQGLVVKDEYDAFVTGLR
jgi:hypothetical protein